MFTSSPRPSSSCTADSNAALTATGLVRSFVRVWPCSACLQLSLQLPSQPLPSAVFCSHLTFHHLLSCPISYFPPGFPYAFQTALCSFWHIFCLDTGVECLPLLRLLLRRYRWNGLILSFPKSPNALQSEFLYHSLHATRAPSEKAPTTESTQYPHCNHLTSACFG
jgi:hypothetical protein